jgi:hypothetical protein
MGFDIGTILGSNLGQMFKDVVGTFKLDPAKKAELQAAIDENQQQIALKQLELQEKVQDSITSEVASASANIRAEAATGDKYTSRARPTFLYVVYVVIAWNYIFLPIIQYAHHTPPAPIALPDALFWLFGSGYLGYTGARSWDKYNAVSNGK